MYSIYIYHKHPASRSVALGFSPGFFVPRNNDSFTWDLLYMNKYLGQYLWLVLRLAHNLTKPFNSSSVFHTASYLLLRCVCLLPPAFRVNLSCLTFPIILSVCWNSHLIFFPHGHFNDRWCFHVVCRFFLLILSFLTSCLPIDFQDELYTSVSERPGFSGSEQIRQTTV